MDTLTRAKYDEALDLALTMVDVCWTSGEDALAIAYAVYGVEVVTDDLREAGERWLELVRRPELVLGWLEDAPTDDIEDPFREQYLAAECYEGCTRIAPHVSCNVVVDF